MKLLINESGNYTCYVGSDYKEKKWTYQCNLKGGWYGFKSNWTSNKAEIVDSKNEYQASLSFKLRIFKPHFLEIIIKTNDELISIKPVFGPKFKNIQFKFEYQNDSYEFLTYKGNIRALYQNDSLVTKFDKKKISFFDKDVFIIDFESHLNPVLIIALALFDDIWQRDSSVAVSIDLGNITGNSSDEIKNWIPKN